ncbi:hypothetical protein HMPREF9098_1924 [Kingella denitrificans ATCC 33394]|uniref:Uncharacterized protein n=1 Tax=Kingella denitrificans ATCC 33394 TaxID=888741 RepID=F0F1D9_9NEIS|nr:hypothetical protein HMPREF9098_1924 [Kingella denitrificans ATCC 33394]
MCRVQAAFGVFKSSAAGTHIGSLNRKFRPMAACTFIFLFFKYSGLK